MNYRHIFHAGNTADVIKHTVLLQLLTALTQKDSGFCYIDTHAACGLYDLTSSEAHKTLEHKTGIDLVTSSFNNPILQKYLDIIHALPQERYPGSPWFAESLSRTQDKLILNELQPDDYQTLKKLFRNNKRVAIHQRDAYEFLPAVIPPALKRGLVLIDPPFELANEKQRITELLTKCSKKWQNGVYMIWLPIKAESLQVFYKSILALGMPTLIIEFFWQRALATANSMRGCSIMILNLPFSAKEGLLTLTSDLAKVFSSIKLDVARV